MILHLCTLDKFIQPFVRFVKENFEDFHSRHLFYVNGDNPLFGCPDESNILRATSIGNFARIRWLVDRANRAEKIVLHGLWDAQVLRLLAIQPWLLRKCYWVIWGGDLYTYKLSKRTLGWWREEIVRRFVIKRFGHFVTHVEGDYELACRWYGARGQWHDCFVYTSNLFNKPPSVPQHHETINVLVGNSANPSNNHIAVLEKLKGLATDRTRIYCPLSYGDMNYARDVENYGRALFGDRFLALRDFIPFQEYLAFLAQIDIAIFNHGRQQAMGTAITLLGLGKKVCMRSDTTTWGALTRLGVKLFDIEALSLDGIDPRTAEMNRVRIGRCFSEAALKSALTGIFCDHDHATDRPKGCASVRRSRWRI